MTPCVLEVQRSFCRSRASLLDFFGRRIDVLGSGPCSALALLCALQVIGSTMGPSGS